MTRQPLPVTPLLLGSSVGTGKCGYVVDVDAMRVCSAPSTYRFRLVGWPSWRTGYVCATHATVARQWQVEFMHSLAGAAS